MGETTKVDPIKPHREGTALYDSRNYEDAIDKFLQASQLYEKLGDFFDSSYTLFKAAECNYILEDYEIAAERFLQAADKMLERGFDRLAPSSLEYAIDCYKAAGNEKGSKVTEVKKKIEELKKKLEAQAF